MKQFLITMLLLLGAAAPLPLFAQSSAKTSLDSAKIAEYRAKLALDYSMPDSYISRYVTAREQLNR